MVAYCNLSGWIRAKPLCTLFSQAVVDFLWKDVICCHGCFGKLIVDEKSENKNAIVELAQRYGIKRVVMSAYHLQANEMIKYGHKLIIDAFSIMLDGSSANWVQNLSTILWADWSTVHIFTGFISYYICCDSKPVLPIELEVSTWQILP